MTSSHRTPAIAAGSPDRPVDPAQDTTGGIAARSTVRGRWAAAATLVAAAVIDLAFGTQASLVVTLVFGPFVACALISARDTAVAAAAATVLSVVLGWPDATVGTSAQLVRVSAVTVGGALAVWLAIQRSRNEAKLLAVTRVAEAAQQTILHPLPAEIDGVRLAARYVSASAEARIGGDFYDATSTPWGTRLVVGDVRGKGLEAVRLASVLLGEFRSRSGSEPDLGALADLVDLAGSRQADGSGEDFATAVFVEFHAGSVKAVRCGHPFPLVAIDGTVEALPVTGSLPLCLGGGAVAETHPLPLRARVLYYSDGAFEGRDRQGRQFDLAASFAVHATTPSQSAVLDGILADLRRHCANGIDDDVVLVLADPTPQ
ncbi:MAG: serine/threonine-protein phosphatase [Actinomycetota bacterium]|nr:serine/threonine-protein phosphatase [Actinomycetota bacterium]